MEFASSGFEIVVCSDEDVVGRIAGQFHPKAIDVWNFEPRLNARATDSPVPICRNDFHPKRRQFGQHNFLRSLPVAADKFMSQFAPMQRGYYGDAKALSVIIQNDPHSFISRL